MNGVVGSDINPVKVGRDVVRVKQQKVTKPASRWVKYFRGWWGLGCRSYIHHRAFCCPGALLKRGAPHQ